MKAYARKIARRMAGRAAAAHSIRMPAPGREPGFVATAVLILAVGIGASTAMFSIVQAVLFRPLGVEAPDRLVMLWTRNTEQSVGELSY